MKSDEFSPIDNSSQLDYMEGESDEMFVSRQSDPITFTKENEAFCFNKVKFAEAYVDAVLTSAVRDLAPKPKSYKAQDIVAPVVEDIVVRAFDSSRKNIYCPGNIPFEQTSVSPKIYSSHTFIGWPKISEFNIKLGLERLEEYIECWQRSSEWLCCVEFLGFESEEASNYFVYEVEFSIPTPIYPIPQATASVFFALEVSKMVPPAFDRPIEVSYVFESSNVIHIPGKIDFQENWIRDILRSKLRFFRTLTF